MKCLELQEKVVLVTGGNRGIGAAIVTLLKDCGALVAYTYRSEASVGADALALQADVTDSTAMVRVAEQVEQKLGPIYGVVANAGITRDNFFTKLTGEDWDAVINTNLKGIYNTLSPVIPKMYERQEGAVVCISSISGERGNIGQTNYAASKFAVIGMMKTWARELGRKGIRANAICPGFIATSILTSIPPKVLKALEDKVPMGRLGKPEEVAGLIIYLASDEAAFVTGANISINGGQHMY